MNFFKFLIPFLVGYLSAALFQGVVFKLMTLAWFIGQLIGLVVVIGIAWLIWKYLKTK
jgi:hypothetical protein